MQRANVRVCGRWTRGRLFNLRRFAADAARMALSRHRAPSAAGWRSLLHSLATMRTFLQLPNEHTHTLPAAFQDDDVRYTEALVAHFVHAFTQPQQLVFDPFAGFGTTLIAAEALGRIASGLEYDPQRVAYIKTQLRHPDNVRQGDARQLLQYGLPRFALSMTSPPYRQRTDSEDPLTAYTTNGTGYRAYLQSLRAIYVQMAQLMHDDGHIVVEVANLKGPSGITTLAWDVAGMLAEVLHFEGEVVVGWDQYGYGYDHSYCLIYTKAPTDVTADPTTSQN